MSQTTTILTAQRYGDAQVLEYRSLPMPQPAAGEALIEVRVAGINPIDARRMTGEFKLGPLPQSFGTEFAGIVRGVGAGVVGWAVGDEVLGSGGAFTHATHIIVPAANLVAKPPSMSWEVAGTLAGASQTAGTILRELALPKNGSLLIHGGSGGVGSITIQLGRQDGLTVVATASAANQEYLADIGAIPVVYGDGVIERIRAAHPAPFDASVDMVGTAEATTTSLAVVKDNGPIASITGKAASSSRVFPIWTKRDRNDLQRVVDALAAGELQWTVSRTYPFADARQAFADILGGHTRGKSALVFGG